MIKKIVNTVKILAVTCGLCIAVSVAQAAAPLPNVTGELQQAGYWINKGGSTMQAAVMSPAQIQIYNRALDDDYLHRGYYSARNFPGKVSRTQVQRWLNDLDFSSDELYVNGKLISPELKTILKASRNIAQIPETVQVRYGVTVRRTNLRTFPTKLAAFESPADKHFDNFQETAVDPSTAVVILHESKNKMFYFVQSDRYFGWLHKSDVATVGDKAKWLKYLNPTGFAVVTAPKLIVNTPGEQLLFQMGSRILLQDAAGGSLQALIPSADALGRLRETTVRLVGDGLHQGYLPYTQANILKQAFKFQGELYGWGGLGNGVDCASFVQNVYRTVGLNLPRNADEQYAAPGVHRSFGGMDTKARLAAVRNMAPGTALAAPTHIVLYLGEANGRMYAIHSLAAYGQPTNGAIRRSAVMRVIVSDLQLQLTSGRLLIDYLDGGVQFR